MSLKANSEKEVHSLLSSLRSNDIMEPKILIIDDDPQCLQLISYLLSHFGYTVYSAPTGEEGLNILEKEIPNLIICDILLPQMDGYQCAAKIKGNERLKSIPLIAFTALAFKDDAERIFAAGFDGYVTKPIDPEEFLKEIEAHLKQAPPKDPRIKDEKLPASKNGKYVVQKGAKNAILVIDNIGSNLDFIKQVLVSQGYQVETASSVKESLLKMEKIKFDLVITDLHMPEHTGYDFIKTIRADPSFRSVRIICITSSQLSKNEIAITKVYGADACLSRPISPEKLIEVVKFFICM